MINTCVGSRNADGTVTVPSGTWMLNSAGKHRCAVSIKSGASVILTTLDFFVCVEANPYGALGIEVYIASGGLDPGDYYVSISDDDYSFTTTQGLPVGGVIRFDSTMGYASTYASEASSTPIESNLVITQSTTGTQLANGVILSLAQISTNANVQAIIDNYSE